MFVCGLGSGNRATGQITLDTGNITLGQTDVVRHYSLCYNNNNNNNSAISFIKDLGHRISQRSGDARETQFLFQRLSVILQRFNAVLFGESFLAAPDDPDM